MSRTKQAAREALGRSTFSLREWYIPAPHDRELSLAAVGAISREYVEVDGYPYWRFKTRHFHADILKSLREEADDKHNYAAPVVANFLTTNPSGVHTYRYEYETDIDSESFLASFNHKLIGEGLITTSEHPYRLLELVSRITDAHLIGETLAYEENFNGKRHYVEVPDVLEAPRPKVVATSPMKVVATSPMKVVATSPMKAIATSPMKAIATSPMKVVATSPMKVVATSPMKAVATTTASNHPIQHADIFELTNWNGNYSVPDETTKEATYLAHWRTIAQTQPETIDERLANIIKLKSFTVYALASNGEIVADLRELNIPYVTSMTRFAAIVTAVILRSPSLSKNDEYKQLIGELTPGL